MIRIYKFLLAVTVAAAFSIGTAMAFQGFSVGVIGNYMTFDTAGYEIEGGGNVVATEKTTGSISHDVEFGSFFVEYTSGNEGGGLGATFGIEHVPGDASIGARSRTDAQSSTDDNGSDDSGTYTAKAEISDYYTFYVEPTLMASENWGIYFKGGASKITVRSLESIALGDDSSAYGNEDVWGVLYGVGTKYVHSSGLFVKAEVVTTEYGTVSLDSTTGNKNVIEADIDSTSARLGLGYNF